MLAVQCFSCFHLEWGRVEGLPSILTNQKPLIYFLFANSFTPSHLLICLYAFLILSIIITYLLVSHMRLH